MSLTYLRRILSKRKGWEGTQAAAQQFSLLFFPFAQSGAYLESRKRCFHDARGPDLTHGDQTQTEPKLRAAMRSVPFGEYACLPLIIGDRRF